LGVIAFIAPFVVSSAIRTLLSLRIQHRILPLKRPLISLRTGSARALDAAAVAKNQTQRDVAIAAEGLRKTDRHGDFGISAVPSLVYREYMRDRLALLV
jgi:hypothetical protein